MNLIEPVTRQYQLDWLRQPDSPAAPPRQGVPLLNNPASDVDNPGLGITELRRQLERYSGRRVELRLNRNRSRWMHLQPLPGGDRWRASLHRAFLHAPPPVLRAVAILMRRNDRRSQRLIRQFIDENYPHTAAQATLSAVRPRALRTAGKVYRLRPLLDGIIAEYFPGGNPPRITWGRRCRLGRTMLLGTYSRAEGLIRVHPALDHALIPEYFLRYVIYHELLHHYLPERKDAAGRRRLHDREFRRREAEFRDYTAAREFERGLFPALRKQCAGREFPF